MDEASLLVTRLESNGKDTMAHLTDEVRAKAWPILGPDPKSPPWWAKKEDMLFEEHPKSRSKKQKPK